MHTTHSVLLHTSFPCNGQASITVRTQENEKKKDWTFEGVFGVFVCVCGQLRQQRGVMEKEELSGNAWTIADINRRMDKEHIYGGSKSEVHMEHTRSYRFSMLLGEQGKLFMAR